MDKVKESIQSMERFLAAPNITDEQKTELTKVLDHLHVIDRICELDKQLKHMRLAELYDLGEALDRVVADSS